MRADAFAREINRLLAPEMNSPGVQFARDIVGAGRVVTGKADRASGVRARGNTLVIHLTRRAPDFPSRTASTFFCAVPPSLPIDAEGENAYPAAGPYYVADYRPGDRVLVLHNKFYGGSRPHHVDGFDVDLRASSPQDVLQRVDRGDADWGYTLAAIYFDPNLGLADKYGINKSRLFLKPGLTLRILAFNSSRPLFNGNVALRKAVNFALNRRALVGTGGDDVSVPTDQFLPKIMPGFKDADVYPLERPDLPRAKELARGNLRGGKAVLYVNSSAIPMAIGQLVRQQLAEIGLDVEVRGIPIHSASAAYFNKLATPGEPWDIAFGLWSPSYIDPFAYINLLLERRFLGASNFIRLASAPYDRQMRHTAALPAGKRSQQSLRGTRRSHRARPGAGRAGRFPQRADPHLEPGRLRRPAADTRPDGRLSQAVRRRRQGDCTATQSSPPSSAMPAGALPILIVATTLLVDGSMRETVRAAVFDTQIDPAPLARAEAPSPTAMSTRAPEAGSIRVTTPSPVLATQMRPARR